MKQIDSSSEEDVTDIPDIPEYMTACGEFTEYVPYDISWTDLLSVCPYTHLTKKKKLVIYFLCEKIKAK